MNVFIFQSTKERYDLNQAIKPGKRANWDATRYRGDMQLDDIVFFWMAGSSADRGLYGWGQISSKPFIMPNWTSHGVDVIYKVKFRLHVPAKVLEKEKGLSDMLIFRAPSATNFLLTDDQSYNLIKVIRNLGEDAPPAISRND